MINKSLPQFCLMLPVCPILVFQLNWKHLSIMGTFDGTSVKLAGRGTIPRVPWGDSKDQSAPLALHAEIPRKGKEWGRASSRRRMSIQSDARVKALNVLGDAD